MSDHDVCRVGVVGGGLMGAGIAEVCARAGLDVIVVERDVRAASTARSRITSSLDRAVERGRLGPTERDAALGRTTTVDDIGALADSHLVVEAVAEDELLKTAVFARLDTVVVQEDAILATNTSSIPVMKLAMATRRPDHVLGVHFFNPVPVLPLVEIVPSLLTANDVRGRAEAFVVGILGKHPIRCQDRAGFIVNALLVPYLLSAIRMLESGFASAEDIDAGMVRGCAHPMGPLHLADLIGLDTTKAIAESMYEEFREPLHAPPPMLSRMVEAGLLGRKTGRGFFRYGDSPETVHRDRGTVAPSSRQEQEN